jgi:DNA-binding sugar fermentation-stimulating protein
MDKEYYENYFLAKKTGVKFLAYRCQINPQEIKIEKKLKIVQ